MSSSDCILRRLCRQRPGSHKARGGHDHTHSFRKARTQAAAEYPNHLCKEILIGISEQPKREAAGYKTFLNVLISCERLLSNLMAEKSLQVFPGSDEPDLEDWGLDNDGSPSDNCGVSTNAPGQSPSNHYADTVTGEPLPPHIVDETCAEEVEFMDE